MLFTVILVVLIPTVTFSSNLEKTTSDDEIEWQEFLKDHPRFQCFTVWQNKTLSADDKVLATCIEEKIEVNSGKPLFNGKVDSEKIKSDYQKKWHKYLIEQLMYRCFAAKINLLLPVDYEVPSGCMTRNDSSSTLFNNETSTASTAEELETLTASTAIEPEILTAVTAEEPNPLTAVTVRESDPLTAVTAGESDTSTISHDEIITTSSVIIDEPNDSRTLNNNSISTEYIYIIIGAFVTMVVVVALTYGYIRRRKSFKYYIIESVKFCKPSQLFFKKTVLDTPEICSAKLV